MVTLLKTIAPTYPNYAAEGQTAPYMVYTKDSTEYERVLDGVDSAIDSITYQFDIIVGRKADTVTYGDQVENKLLSMWNTTVGGKIIQDVEIINRLTDYQNEIEKYREIIEIKVSY